MIYIKLYSAIFLFFKTQYIQEEYILIYILKHSSEGLIMNFFNTNKENKAPVEQRVADSSYKDLIFLVPLTL